MIGRGIPSIQSNMPRPIGKSPYKIFGCRNCLTVCSCISSFCKAADYANCEHIWIRSSCKTARRHRVSVRLSDGLAAAWRDTFVFAIGQRSGARRLALVSQMFFRMRPGRGVVLAIDWLFVSLFDCSLSFRILVHIQPPVGCRRKSNAGLLVPYKSNAVQLLAIMITIQDQAVELG